MATLSLHGLDIALSLSGFGARRPTFPLTLPSSTSAPALTISLVAEERPSGLPEGARPVFFHGLTRVYVAGAELWMEDQGLSVLRIAADGARIDGQITARSLEDEYSFTHATLFIALVLALRHRGLFHLHAGAVVRGERVLLIPGASGNGKSSTTMAMLAAGWDYVGDDAVFLREGARLEVLGVPKVFHLDDRAYGPFRDLGLTLGDAYRSNHQKRAFDPTVRFGDRARLRAPAPTSLVFPCVRDRPDTIVSPLSQAEAFGALVESAPLFLLEGLARAEEQRALLAELAMSAAAVSLELGRDALADRGVIPRLLGTL